MGTRIHNGLAVEREYSDVPRWAEVDVCRQYLWRVRIRWPRGWVGDEQCVRRGVRTVYIKQELGNDEELPAERTYDLKEFED